jgi:hypothetical protein
MAFINLSPELRIIFDSIERRLRRVEQTKRFTVPYINADPTSPQNGDMWYNTTTNQLKVYVNSTTKIVTIV